MMASCDGTDSSTCTRCTRTCGHINTGSWAFGCRDDFYEVLSVATGRSYGEELSDHERKRRARLKMHDDQVSKGYKRRYKAPVLDKKQPYQEHYRNCRRSAW